MTSAQARYVSRVANETYGHSRRLLPEQPWWNNLDPAFHKYPDDFYLDLRTQAMVEATAAVDVGIRTAAATLALTMALPTTLSPSLLRHDHAQWDHYKALADGHDAKKSFPRPRQAVNVRKHKPPLLEYRPEDGSVEVLSFESQFQPLNPGMREHYARFRRNRIAWAEHWRHDGPPRPTICLIHGYVADPYWVNSRFMALPWFYKMGFNVLLYTLPFHGRRKEWFAPVSGHGVFSYGLCHINETIAHAVHDFRLFLDYLEGTGVPQFGVTGISLGGYTTSLLAAVEDRLAFAVPNVPLASLIDLVLEWFPVAPVVKAALRATGTSVQEARHVTAMCSPLTYKPLLPKNRLMIVGGAGDRFAPPKHTRLIWDHWDHPRLHWFPGNHLIHLDQGRYLKEMARFLRGIGFDRG
ncbi:MAG: abhydrolase 18 [Moraxellaceae bacterium]|jgi:pimeloyl-ACP methyl ester carboxylesterase|nr:abhydrolase 18 [Moraxellaceae bacterium]